MLDIISPNPLHWVSFIPRLGGMHGLMSFAGSAGKLMQNSGLENLMMLQGKKFPMNIRALRFVVVELLRDHMGSMNKYDDLEKFMDDVSSKSCLAEHWVNNLIKPILLMMVYVRAEREGEFALHLDVCKKMLPYFFTAGHWNCQGLSGLCSNDGEPS